MAARRFLTAEQGVEQLLKATPPLHFNGTTKTGVARVAKKIPAQSRQGPRALHRKHCHWTLKSWRR